MTIWSLVRMVSTAELQRTSHNHNNNNNNIYIFFFNIKKSKDY